MASIDRTAYPTLAKPLSDEELSERYTLSDQETEFITQKSRDTLGPLVLAVMLKTRQQLDYFIGLALVPDQILKFIAEKLELVELEPGRWPPDEISNRTSLHRYRLACRQWLQVTAFSDEGKNCLLEQVNKAALTMSDPADLINVAIETLSNARIDLPAFSTLSRLVKHERQLIHQKLYRDITSKLSNTERDTLDDLLVKPEGEYLTPFARMKQTPGPATLTHFRAWANRLIELDAIIDPKPFFKGVAYTKIRQFAAQASSLAIGNIRGVTDDPKRRTLLLSLLYEVQTTTRDELIEMFLRRMRSVHNKAKERLRALQDEHRELEESLIDVLGKVLHKAEGAKADKQLGQQVRALIEQQGGVDALTDKYKRVTAYHNNNYRPLLWDAHATNRAVMFRVLEHMEVKSATQDQSLLQALEFVCQHRTTRKELVPAGISLHFASDSWQRFVLTKQDKELMLDRKSLEICVFSYLADALESGDLYVEHSGAYSDYRQQLLPWRECEKRLPEYCEALGLDFTGNDFVSTLKAQLTELSESVDKQFPKNSEFSIDGASPVCLDLSIK